MHTSNCWDSIETGSLPIERLDYRSTISPIVLLEIHTLSWSMESVGCLGSYWMVCKITTSSHAWRQREQTYLRGQPFKIVLPYHSPSVRKWTCLQPAQFPFVWCVDVCNSEACQLGDHYLGFGFLWHCSIEKNGDSGVPNKKAGYRNDTMLSFQKSPGCMHVWMLPSDCRPPVCIQYRHRGPASGMMVWAANRWSDENRYFQHGMAVGG